MAWSLGMSSIAQMVTIPIEYAYSSLALFLLMTPLENTIDSGASISSMAVSEKKLRPVAILMRLLSGLMNTCSNATLPNFLSLA